MNQRAILCTCLAAALALPAPGWSQQAKSPQSQPASSGGLKITAIQGNGASNDIRKQAATPPVVEVRDESDKPVAGAEVTFRLPADGPSGMFFGMMRTQTLRTDEQGRAAATGFRPNEEAGRFNIEVAAAQGAKRGSIYISQTNGNAGSTAKATDKKSHKTLYWVLGIAAAGAIGGGIAATRGGSSTAADLPVPISVAAGPVTVGGPR